MLQVTISDEVNFPAEVLYHMPKRDRWAIRMANGQQAAAREDQITVLFPAGVPPPAYLDHDGMGATGGCSCSGGTAEIQEVRVCVWTEKHSVDLAPGSALVTPSRKGGRVLSRLIHSRLTSPFSS